MTTNTSKARYPVSQELTTYNCKLCHVCNAPNSTSYCKCRAVFYCQPEHAELDKPNHGPHCDQPLYSTVKGFNKGVPKVTLVANKNLLPGQRIVAEYPLICGPMDNDLDTNRVPTCLGCCVRNKVSKRKRDPKLNNGIDKCSSCGWPVCSSICEKVTIYPIEQTYHHAVNECRYFQENNITYPADSRFTDDGEIRCKYFLYKGILVLRALLLKNRDILAFQEFLKLPARGPSDEETIKLIKTHRKLILKLLQDFQALSLLSSDPLVAEEEISTILDRLCLYGFAKPISEMQYPYARIKGQVDAVYRCGSVIKRACNSNVTWNISDGPDFVLLIRATKSIKKDEELMLPYSADLFMKDTPQRQEHIMKVIGAPCLCARCVDRTEFGSYFSAVKCPECKNGYLLPSNPVKKTSSLECCLNKGCHHSTRPHMIYKKVNEIWKSSSDILSSSSMEKVGIFPTKSVELKSHINHLRTQEFLHPNHSIIFRLVWEVVKRDIYNLPSFNWVQLSDFIKDCEYLGRIEESFGHLFSQNRGNKCQFITKTQYFTSKTDLACKVTFLLIFIFLAILHFYMGRAFYQQYEILKTKKARNMSRTDTLIIMENIMNLYDECRKFFKNGGHEIERIIHEDMKTIVSIINKSKLTK